jgi:Mg2+/Co2+ transporter CorB
MVTISIITILVLLVLSAGLAGTEAAYLSLSRARLQAYVKEEVPHAKLTVTIRSQMEKLISTLMLTNNLVNTLMTAISSVVFTEIFGAVGVVYATAMITVLIVVFAELIPKFYAVRKAETIAMGVAPALALLIRVFKPISWVMEKFSKRLLRGLGVMVDEQDSTASALEELRGAIDLHRGLDQETRESRAMLHSILDLGDVSVEEVLIHRNDVKMLNLNDDLDVLLQQIIQSHHTRLPLHQGDSDQIIGIIHTKDFLRLMHAPTLNPVKKDDLIAMAKKPWFIPETAKLFEQLQAFRQRREHMALVVDEYGTFQGVVTLEDIIEEIVGSIDDEHDPYLTGVWQTKGGEIYAAGTTTLRDLNRMYGWDLPDEDAATLAGLIMREARAIPDMGQTFRIEGLTMKILRRVRNQISLVKIDPPLPPLPEA